VLAVDAGSSRLRVSVIALEDGEVLRSGARATRSCAGELDLDALWADLVELGSSLDLRGIQLLAVAVAAQLGTVIVDERGRPVRPAILWSDARAVEEADWLADTLPDNAAAITGRPLTAELPVAKLRWLARHEPASWQRARRVHSLKDAIVQRLTARSVTDETHASYTGLFDVHARVWSAVLAQTAGIDRALLPPTAPGAALAGALTPDAAAALGLRAGMAVAVGGPDGTLGAVGAGAVRAGVTVDVAGTTDVLLRTIEEPLVDDAGAAVLNAHVVPGLWTTGGPTGLTGGAVEWTARLLGFASAREAHEVLGDAADAMPGADGAVFVTALAGTRFPTWDTGRTGVVAGLRPDHGPAHLLRAAEEGAAFMVAEGLDAIRNLGLTVDEVVVVGGAAARGATLQLRSDSWDLPVVALTNTESTTIGAAILAAVAAGEFADLDAATIAFVHRGEPWAPREQAAQALRAARSRWRAVALSTAAVEA